MYPKPYSVNSRGNICTPKEHVGKDKCPFRAHAGASKSV